MLDLLNSTQRVNPNYTSFECLVAQLPKCDDHWKYPDAKAISKRFCQYNGFNYQAFKRRLVDEGYAVWGTNYYNGIHQLDKTGEWEVVYTKKNDRYCQPVWLTQKAYDLSRAVYNRLKGEKKIREVKHTQWHGLQPISNYHIIRRENISVDVQALQELIDYYKESNKKTDQTTVNHAQMILDHTDNGNFHQMYYINRTGRYTAIGISLQNVKREVRFAALRGKWSYDIHASHPTIFNQINPHPVIEDYINRKDEIRKAIQKECNLTKDQAKTVITGIQYGACCKKGFSLHQKIKNKIEQVKENQWIKEWKEAWSSNPTGYTGRLIEERNLPWVLQFLESQILQSIIDNYSVQCLTHDGWVSEKRLDTREMEEIIYSQTGFSVTIQEEKL